MLVFLGGGGAGLSALANIFFELGFDNIVVLDKYQSEITDKLAKKGIKVIIGENKYNFSDDDIIIYSDAVINGQDFQRTKNTRKFSYFQFLGEISKRFETIAIAGTHGKSSTTSMLLHIFKNLNLENFGLGIVGAFVPQLNNNNYLLNSNAKSNIRLIFEKILTAKGTRPAHLFKKYIFAVEADEFNKHFLLLDPSYSLITKVDYDHADIYPSENDYLKAFIEFINKTRNKSYTLDKNFFEKVKNKINYPNLLKVTTNNTIFQFKYVFGEHMQKNANLLFTFLNEFLNIDNIELKQSLENFKGLWRRQEYLGKLGNLADNYQKIKDESYEIIGLAMKIHSKLGGGLQEKIYKKALKEVLKNKGFEIEEEKQVKIKIDDTQLTFGKIDLVVNKKVALEIKSTKQIIPDFYKQLRKYLRFGDYKYGLIINFGKKSLGFRRLEKNYQLSENCPNNYQISIYSDYAHHPVEIQTTYEAFKQHFPNKKIYVIFQPHQLFRFLSYKKDFINVLRNIENLVIYDIYSVREEKLIEDFLKENKIGYSSYKEGVEKIGKILSQECNAKYIKNLDELLDYLQNKNGIALIMSAGDLDYKIRQFI